MGKVWSRVVYPRLQRYNFENRAQKAIKKQTDKGVRAPTYEIPTPLQEFAEEHADELKKKDDKLLERLKHVKVDSFGPPPQIKTKSSRPLPEDRNPIEEHELGYREPNRVPVGKMTLHQATKFLMEHEMNPKDYTANVIAKEYKLDPVHVENVLKYFAAFSVYIPKSMTDRYPKVAKVLEKGQVSAPKDITKQIEDSETKPSSG